MDPEASVGKTWTLRGLCSQIERGTRNPGRETMLKFETLYSVPDRLLFPDLFRSL
ncbi:hypothetical protein PO124_24200 [Bacillus licheniformis]|nr:hypothetical protein [Bacillus licheniformis]